MSEEQWLEHLLLWRETNPTGTKAEALAAIGWTDEEKEAINDWWRAALILAGVARDVAATRSYTSRLNIDEQYVGLGRIVNDPATSSIVIRILDEGLIDVSVRDQGTVLRTAGDNVLIFQRGDWERELMRNSP